MLRQDFCVILSLGLPQSLSGEVVEWTFTDLIHYLVCQLLQVSLHQYGKILMRLSLSRYNRSLNHRSLQTF